MPRRSKDTYTTSVFSCMSGMRKNGHHLRRLYRKQDPQRGAKFLIKNFKGGFGEVEDVGDFAESRREGFGSVGEGW